MLLKKKFTRSEMDFLGQNNQFSLDFFREESRNRLSIAASDRKNTNNNSLRMVEEILFQGL